MTSNPQFISSQSLRRLAVVNVSRQILGHVEEIMFDVESGHIIYVVIVPQSATFKRLQKLAIPWNLLRYDAENRYLVVNKIS